MAVEEIVHELIEIENQLDEWATRMVVAVDSESSAAKSERAALQIERCVELCRHAFGDIRREFER